MEFYLNAILLLVGSIVFVQIRYVLRLIALRNWGKQSGCANPPHVPNKLPWGMERLIALLVMPKEFDLLEDLFRKRFIDMGSETFRAYNPFNTSVVLTSEPANIQAVLATKMDDYELERENFESLLGKGIFTADGEAWSHYRALLKPQFTRDQVSDLESAGQHLEVLFDALPKETASGWIESVDIMPYLFRFTMDTSTEFLFGESVNSQSVTLQSQASDNLIDAKEEMAFTEAMSFAQEYLSWRMRFGKLCWLISSKKFRDTCKIVQNFADKFVQKALSVDNKKLEGATDQPERFVLLNSLVLETRDPIELRNQVLHILLAGRDTTAALLSWAILLLSRHPEEFLALRDTVISTFGTAKHPTQPLTFSTLKACKPLTYLLYETMRLYPLIPVSSKGALRNTILPTGGGPDRKQPVAVKKGERVVFSVYVMHRRKDIWGDDADGFRPQRWEGRKLGWDYLPFSGGPRVCLGQQYALNEASFVLVKILQRYDKIEALNLGSIKKGLTLTLSPGDGVKVKMHRATD